MGQRIQDRQLAVLDSCDRANRARAAEMVAAVKGAYPGRRVALSRTGAVIGLYSDSEECWHPCFGLLVTGRWGAMPSVLVDGKPLVDPADWVEATD